MATVLATSGTTPATTTTTTTSGFNEENFLRKLDNVQPTQDSIQSLALWIIHHKANHEIICRLWMKKLKDSNNGKQRLALFYLANDVIQNCRRKNAKIFQDTFKTCLIEAVKLVRNDSIKKKIERVFDVWSERNVYEQEFIVKLTDSLYKEDKDTNKMSAKSPPPPKSPPLVSSIILGHPQPSEPQPNTKNEIEYQKIIAEFQPKNLRESIGSFFSLQNEVNLAKSNVEATRLLDINVDHIKQYRDKSQCSKFKIEFENSCAKLEEYIHKLSDEAEKRKQLVQLLNQSEIFYDAQFKDATTVYNAYKSYGSKVSLVKRKLDELIISKFNSNDVKLDNLDMEMSEEDEDDDAKLKKAKSNYAKHSSSSSKSSRSPPHVSTSSSASSSNGSIRNNLDPRQNRLSHHHSSSSSSNNNNKKSSSSSFYKQNQSNTIKRTKSEDKDGCNTPVKDECSPIKSSSSTSNNNPLDFLTKFINKSSTNSNEPTPTTASSSSSNTSSSANLSYLVDSLKKFVNTNTSSNTAYTETNSYIPQPAASSQPSQYIYDPSSLNSQATYVPTSQTILQQQQQQRSATPTKDEIYQPTALMPPMPPLPPPLPPLPVDTIHNQPPPGPNSPYLPPPAPYHPMMYSPGMYPPPPMYLQGPPPPTPLQMQQPPPPPPPNMPLMMIDPNNCYQYPAQSQPGTKMMISPTLSNTSTNSSNSNLNQPNSPNNPNQGYWSNPATPTGSNQFNNFTHPAQLDDSFSDDNQMRLNNNTKRNNNNYNNDNSNNNHRANSNEFHQSPYNNNNHKRNKYNSNYDDSYNNGNNYTNNKGYSRHQQNQRIPTINSQRDRGSNYADTQSTNNNRGGANQSGRY